MDSVVARRLRKLQRGKVGFRVGISVSVSALAVGAVRGMSVVWRERLRFEPATPKEFSVDSVSRGEFRLPALAGGPSIGDSWITLGSPFTTSACVPAIKNGRDNLGR
jgi:hypothetical protein